MRDLRQQLESIREIARGILDDDFIGDKQLTKRGDDQYGAATIILIVDGLLAESESER